MKLILEKMKFFWGGPDVYILSLAENVDLSRSAFLDANSVEASSSQENIIEYEHMFWARFRLVQLVSGSGFLCVSTRLQVSSAEAITL